MPKQPADHYAPSAWGEAAKRREGFDFTTPSGQLCRIKPIPLEEMVLSGIIDDLDSVTKIVDSDIAAKIAPGVDGKSSDETTIADGLKFMRSEAGRSAIEMMGKIIPAVVVAPVILPDPENHDDREEGKIYVSDVSLTDRAAIFSIVMEPTEKAAQFRA